MTMRQRRSAMNEDDAAMATGSKTEARDTLKSSSAKLQYYGSWLKQQQQPLFVIMATAVVLCFLFFVVVNDKRILRSYNAQREEITKMTYEPIPFPDDTYNVFQCPDVVPAGYPREYNVLHVLGNWSIDDLEHDTSSVRMIHQGICIFDYDLDTKIIHTYRQAEVPFVVRNDPSVRRAVRLWKDDPTYLKRKLQGQYFEATLSNTTDMTYFSVAPESHDVPTNFTPPTRFAPMTFDEWYRRATMHYDHEEYAYLRLDACLSSDSACDATYRAQPHLLADANFIYDDLDFFHPHKKESSLYLDTTTPRGIQCRLAAPGLIATNHFDNERNAIVLLQGERRYLLSHPRHCPHMALYPQRHPFERHSQVNWSDPDLTTFPEFQRVTVNEVVLQAGDVLYLPTFWFHHIVSLTLNYQCNTRSGYSVEYDQTIYDCGFFYDFPE